MAVAKANERSPAESCPDASYQSSSRRLMVFVTPTERKSTTTTTRPHHRDARNEKRELFIITHSISALPTSARKSHTCQAYFQSPRQHGSIYNLWSKPFSSRPLHLRSTIIHFSVPLIIKAMRTPVKTRKGQIRMPSPFFVTQEGKRKKKGKCQKEKKDCKHTKEDTRNVTRTEQEKTRETPLGMTSPLMRPGTNPGLWVENESTGIVRSLMFLMGVGGFLWRM